MQRCASRDASNIPFSNATMEYQKDLEIANQFMESAPPNTLGSSPILDHIIDYLSFKPDSPLGQELHSKEFIPYLLLKYNNALSETPVDKIHTRTPIDQTLLYAFSQVNATDTTGHKLSDEEIEERYDFCIRQVHCLDYLDYVRCVIHVLTDKAIAFEMEMWAEYEAATILADDEDIAKWYQESSCLPLVFQGWTMEEMVDASAEFLKRTGRIMGVLGEHYSCEMLALIRMRPQHSTGSYFINNHVTAR